MPNSGTKQSFNDQAIKSIHRDGGGLRNSGAGVVANFAALAAGRVIALVAGGKPPGVAGQIALAPGRPGAGGGAFHRARLPAGQRRADAVGLPPGPLAAVER